MKVVCALSGGSAKGAAHIGAIRALSEHGLEPSRFVGTSIGAVFGALFASGLPEKEILARVSGISRRDVARVNPLAVLGVFAPSLLKGSAWRNTIRKLIPAEKFSDLEIPLTVTAVDVDTGELVLFGDGGEVDVPIADALYASTALPVQFPPAIMGNRKLADGGLRTVLPLDVSATFEPDLVFAVNVGPKFVAHAGDGGVLSSGIFGAHRYSVRILMAEQTRSVVERWRNSSKTELVLVEPDVKPRKPFSVGGVSGFVDAGYRAAVHALEERSRSNGQ
ncbi:MAG: patatin-like phospholipase family protein [Gemmatimonadota bacterium]|nr:patatin-like phospholipase family protein [Gemmatimonadota bacterium]